MKEHAPSRRDFLCSTSFVAVGLATGGSMILAPDNAWALSPTALDSHTAQTLVVMARQLFPHDRLGDQYYATVVEAVDKQAASDAARFYHDQATNVLQLESSLYESVGPALRELGHNVVSANGEGMGGYQAIALIDGVYRGGSDHRKDGQAVGW